MYSYTVLLHNAALSQYCGKQVQGNDKKAAYSIFLLKLYVETLVVLLWLCCCVVAVTALMRLCRSM